MSDASRVLNRRTFFKGDIIFNEGDYGSQAYVLQTGRVRITKALVGGGRGTLGFVEAGGIFGEMALIDQSKRMASALAEESCVCIVITEELLTKKLNNTDPGLKMLIMMLIRMLRQAASKTPLPPDDLAAMAQAANAAEHAAALRAEKGNE